MRVLTGLGAALLWFAGISLAAGGSDLIQAVKQGDTASVRALLARHADVNATEADGSTALHWAAQRDSLPLVELLLEAGANARAATEYNITPLSLACTNGDAAIIERLLKAGADPNGTSEKGQTALMTAALTGKVDAVKILLAHGANPNAVEPHKGQTALMWAASEGNAAAAEMLIEFGAGVKARSASGFTPLLFAVRNGHIDVVKALLAHGANVNDAAPDSTSALNMAVVNAYFELASVLLDHGADPNAPDPRGSALHTIAWLRKPGSDGAAGVGNTPHAPPLPTGNMTALELARRLLEHGANPNIRVSWKEKVFDKEGGTVKNPPLIQLGRHFLSYVGATPLYIAAQNGDAEYMRLLADHGADPKMPTRYGITPLMAAAGLGTWEGETPGPFTGVSEAERLEAVKLALELGNDINARADFGGYPMIGTAQNTLLQYPQNMDDLLDLGVGDPRWSGCTALHGAVTSGQASIVQFLVDHGAQVDAKNKLGWTPLMLAQGVFFANAKKEYPAAAAILKKALTQQGLLAAGTKAPETTATPVRR
ncbi:MAG TPA: ankyrin repeat domain-containing protein [Bryobacteraceae bacterium]|nr:ankyrin repeat domain-containing protein [Bryobacteraceae bacterium]